MGTLKKNILITGGAGFIGSHVVRLFVNKYPEYHILNLDKLTYAGNLANLKDIENRPNYTFIKADICDYEKMQEIMQQYRVDGIIHLAAESHVDRSIKDPFTFARTNVMGTLSLLQAAKVYWENLPEKYEGKRFYHISTDEVYGALKMTHPEGIKPPFTTTASSETHHLAYGEEFSSGGVFEEISHFIIRQRGIVYGVVYDTDWIVCHKRIDNISDLNKFRGSKYVQSDLKDVFQTVYSDLKSNRLVLFSGTPCQIAGLKSYLRKDYENLVTCEVICHGVPSPLLFKDYVSFIQKERKKIIAHINMKDKTNGWGNQSLKLVYKDGSTEHGTLLTNLWNRIYYSNKALRPSCYSCKFTDYSRCADIALGDYWNLNKFHPEIYNKNGVSLILIQTSKGINVFNNIRDSFFKIKLNIGEYPQESLESPIKIPLERDLFWQDYFEHGFKFISKKYYGYENKKWKLFLRAIKNTIRKKLNK